MGSTPIFYGLSSTDELDISWKEKINKFVALSPCLLPTIPSKSMTSTTEVNEADEEIIDPLTGEPKITVTYEPFIG